jgi:hypothetical protein
MCCTKLYMYNVDTTSACWNINCWYRLRACGLLSLLLETEQIHNSWLGLSMKGGDHVRFHICNFKSIRELTDILNLFAKPCALVMKWQCRSLNFRFHESTNRHLLIPVGAFPKLTPLNRVFETTKVGRLTFIREMPGLNLGRDTSSYWLRFFVVFLSSSAKFCDNTLMRPWPFPF